MSGPVRGTLIAIEGVDGAGKTTLAAALAQRLRSRGREIEQLREPGGVAAAERIRALVADPALAIGPRAEALLFAAARAQLVEERIEPALAAGRWVMVDRFVDSSLAYQGGGRMLGVPEIRAINEFATSGLWPDLTLLLTVDPGTGAARRATRGTPPDRLEQAGNAFQASTAAAYRALVAAEPERFHVIDAEAPPDVVLDSALGALGGLE